jgi:hypothetical protein
MQNMWRSCLAESDRLSRYSTKYVVSADQATGHFPSALTLHHARPARPWQPPMKGNSKTCPCLHQKLREKNVRVGQYVVKFHFAVLASDTNAVEDYRKGYPRFSAFVGAHDSLQIFRRFSGVRTRLLLLAQDEVTQLEAELNGLDEDEKRSLWLMSSRRDKNPEREKVISDLRITLKAYGGWTYLFLLCLFCLPLADNRWVLLSGRELESCWRIGAFEAPNPQDATTLRNWNRANSCLSGPESEFLEWHSHDLLCLSQPRDTLQVWLEHSIPRKLLWLTEVCQFPLLPPNPYR